MIDAKTDILTSLNPAGKETKPRRRGGVGIYICKDFCISRVSFAGPIRAMFKRLF